MITYCKDNYPHSCPQSRHSHPHSCLLVLILQFTPSFSPPIPPGITLRPPPSPSLSVAQSVAQSVSPLWCVHSRAHSCHSSPHFAIHTLILPPASPQSHSPISHTHTHTHTHTRKGSPFCSLPNPSPLFPLFPPLPTPASPPSFCNSRAQSPLISRPSGLLIPPSLSGSGGA